METPLLTAIAVLSGSAIGGAASFFSSWLAQRAQFRTQLFLQNKGRRETLYEEFIEEASQAYINALTCDEPDLSKAIRLYALISRMRVMSLTETIQRAERVARLVIDSYEEPNKTFGEVREMIIDSDLDPLRDFSEACRGNYPVDVPSDSD